MAEKQLERIGTEVGERWPGTFVAITHRIGTLQISDLCCCRRCFYTTPESI